MNARPLYEDAHLARQEQATLWLQRMHSAGPDDRIVEAWLDWCQRDPMNQQAFDEMASVWELSGQLSGELRSTGPGASANTGSRRTFSRRHALAASLAVLGLATTAGAWLWSNSAADQVLTAEFSSPVGVNSVQTLADGSVLELGGDTRVTVTIGPRERRVELHEGELFVSVYHDTSRPFLVDTDSLEVMATGTAFNVRHTPNRSTVTVAEGSVAAFSEGQRTTAPNVRLKTGQQMVYSHASHSMDVREADPGEAIAWRTGALNFKDEPLSEVIASVNRYATRTILIEDPRVMALSVTGTAWTDRIDGWLQGLPYVFEVEVTQLAEGHQLIGLRPDARSD